MGRNARQKVSRCFSLRTHTLTRARPFALRARAASRPLCLGTPGFVVKTTKRKRREEENVERSRATRFALTRALRARAACVSIWLGEQPGKFFARRCLACCRKAAAATTSGNIFFKANKKPRSRAAGPNNVRQGQLLFSAATSQR